MVTCPVCEHQQQATAECENCGKALGPVVAAAAMPVQVEPVEGLEATGPVALGEVPVVPMSELEVISREATAAVQVERMPDVELSHFESPRDVAVEPMPDLDDARAPDDGVRTPAPSGPVTCRYCRNVQAEGVICEKCGMRLPKAAGPAAAVAGGKVDLNAQKIWTRCRKCGAPAAVGHRCGDCGHEVPIPES